jgi:uncharacterized protein
VTDIDLAPYQDPAVIDAALRERWIAVVGLSANPARDSHDVASYLQRHGYRIVPVNPNVDEVLGEASHASLADIPADVGPIGVVDVFRDPAAVPEIARQAVAIGARFLWLQRGVISEEGARIAADAGLGIIVDRCMMVEHRRRAPRR